MFLMMAEMNKQFSVNMKINSILKKIAGITLWIIALICLGIGMYAAIGHSLNMLVPYNYFLSPLSDDAYDAALVTYPMLTGEDSLWHIIRPFADHRIVTERLFAAFDFIYTNGTQSTLGLRYVFFLWVTYGLMARFIFQINSLSTSIKIFLSGMVLSLTFLTIRLGDFFGETLFTWPQVMLYSFCAFLFLEKYTSINLNHDTTRSYHYLLLTSLFVILVLFSFNIGLVIWPIVFVILYKRNTLRHLKSWLFISGISYFIYFSTIQPDSHYWGPPTLGRGITAFIFHPLVYCSYLSRLVSLPLVPSALIHASLLTYLIGCTLVVSSLFFLFYFLKKPVWRREDTVLFPCIAFGFIAVILISVGRFWIASEYASMGTRFITPSLFLWASLIISTFFIISTAKNRTFTFLTSLATLGATLWLLFCLLGNVAMMQPEPLGASQQANIDDIDVGDVNRYFIALATGVPLNDSLINSTGGCTYHDNGKPHLTYLNKVQHEYHKSAYSLWPARIMNQKLDNLSFHPIYSNSSATVHMVDDLRNLGNSAIYVNVLLPKQQLPLSKHTWYLLATDNNTIVGFGIRSPTFIDLLNSIFHDTRHTNLIWKGVINSALVKGNEVKLWLANEDDELYWLVGSLNIQVNSSPANKSYKLRLIDVRLL
jgi:hypothetical protein